MICVVAEVATAFQLATTHVCVKKENLHDNTTFYIDTSVLLENTPLVKFIRNYIRDSSGVFSISSVVGISIVSLISSLSLKLYLSSAHAIHDVARATTCISSARTESKLNKI